MLRHLKLRDYCCHRQLEVEFQPGINCIVGSNGSGKTTLISAIYSALTNVHEHPDGVSGSIRQGADSAMIEAVFDDFTVTRTLGERNKHLMVAGEERWTSAKEIEQQLAHRFGMVKAVLDKFMFIRQGRFSEIITLPTSERQKMLAYLSNVDYFETLWNRLAEEKKVHEAAAQLGPSFDEQTVRAQVEQLTDKLEESEAELLQLQEQLAPYVAAKGAYGAAIELGQKLKTARETLDSNQEELTRLQTGKQSFQVDLDTASAEYDEVEQRSRTLRLNAAERRACDEFDKYERQRPQYESMAAELDAASDALANYDAAAVQQDLESLQASATKLQERAARLQMQLRQAAATGSGKACEVCGAPPEAQFKGDPATIRRTLDRARTELAESQRQQSELNDLVREQKHNASRVATLTEQLAEYDPETMESKRAGVEELKARSTAHSDIVAELNGIKTRISIADAGLKNTSSLLASLERTVAESQRLISHAAQIEQEEREAHQATVEMAQLETAITALSASAAAERSHLASLEALLRQVAQKRRQQKLVKYLELLDEVRSLTHRSEIPQIISKRFLGQLISQINAYLVQFDAPFKAAVGGDLSFRALMSNGATVPAAALSGGQRCTLALALWLSTFQSQVGRSGFIVFDEPSDSLDAANRVLFNRILAQTDQLFKAQGRQIIIVTHDASLSDGANTISL